MSYRILTRAALVLAFVVVVVGAYVRLEDAGLGCPDWPGCYGRMLGVPETQEELAHAQQAFPGKPPEPNRARKEMFHRYLAGTLGLLILALAAGAWRLRGRTRHSAALPVALVGLVAFQATLGMWTVTLLLKPAVVTLHLIGGMAILSLLTWLALREGPDPVPPRGAHGLRPWAAAALFVLACQIGLGGWVSSNYAALACVDFPTCNGAWLPPMDFHNAFHALRELGMTAAGAPLPHEALTAIQWTHRVGALVTAIVVGGLAAALLRRADLRKHGVLLLVLLVLQVALGAGNVVARLPLVLAVAHNAGAALLLAALVMLNFTIFQGVRVEGRRYDEP